MPSGLFAANNLGNSVMTDDIVEFMVVRELEFSNSNRNFGSYEDTFL